MYISTQHKMLEKWEADISQKYFFLNLYLALTHAHNIDILIHDTKSNYATSLQT